MVVSDKQRSDQQNIDSELIGIVYEVAFDQNFWPSLLEGISHLFGDEHAESQESTSVPDRYAQVYSQLLDDKEKRRLATLLPHLYRALKLKRDYNSTDHSLGQAQAIIEQFPLGVLMVNANAEIISANRQALNTIARNDSLYLKDNRLYAASKQSNEKLASLIQKAATANPDIAGSCISCFKILGEDKEIALTLLITPDPYPIAKFDRQDENSAAIFIGSASVEQHISTKALQTLFGLSQAEARLASLLASGDSLSEAAEQSFISKNTAKVQLKSIFTKLGVNRQAELIKVILTSPAVIEQTERTKENNEANKILKRRTRINKEDNFQLKDGRHLQLAEFGDPHGIPVIHIHGILGCRYERLPDDVTTRDLNIRLIIPDRPGYGLSDPAPGHGYLEYADDLLELLNYLELEQCFVMGLSVGAVYGSAFAYKAPQRLQRLAMISTTPPFRSFADFKDVPASLKLLIAFSKYLPSAAKMITEMAICNACQDVDKFLKNIPVCASDIAIFSHQLLHDHIKHCLLTGNKYHQSGFVDDILLSAQPWPFPVSDIQTPIDFWHGTEDTHSPLSRVKPVIGAIKNHNFHSITGGGHFLIYEYWDKILQTLITSPTSSSQLQTHL